MNCEQANSSISLTDLMSRLGFEVRKKERSGSEWRYLSPFRKEADPSFYINTRDNCWFDHGEGEGSHSVIDFAIKYLGSEGRSSSVKDALSWLTSLGYDGSMTKPLFPAKDKRDEISQDEVPRDLEFIRAKPVTHPAIFQYLNGRGIPDRLISKYLQEIQYRNLKKDKVYFGFGLSNRAGGYEIRSASDTPAFKTALIKRDISLLDGAGDGSTLNIFEGMTDYLSLLVFLKTDRLAGHSLIMHSLSSIKVTLEHLVSINYVTVNLWLDNDKSGRKMANRIDLEHPGEVLDQSSRYSGFSDLNQALRASMEQKTKFDFTP